MMGRNNDQYGSQNSRNKGNTGRKMKLEEHIPKKGFISSVKTLPCLHSKRMGQDGLADFIGQQFSKHLSSYGLEVGVILRWGVGGHSSILLVREPRCSFLLCVGQRGGVEKNQRPDKF